MKRLKWLILITAALAGYASAGPIITFTLDPPEGLLAGLPGTSVGWGYTIATDSDYILIDYFQFVESSPVGIFSTPYVPLAAASFGSPITAPWNQDSSGLQYDIDGGAALYSSTHGPISLTYDTYSDSLLTDQIGFGDTVNAQFNGQDVNAEVDVVPEPGTMMLLGAGLAAVLLRRVVAHLKRPADL